MRTEAGVLDGLPAHKTSLVKTYVASTKGILREPMPRRWANRRREDGQDARRLRHEPGTPNHVGLAATAAVAETAGMAPGATGKGKAIGRTRAPQPTNMYVISRVAGCHSRCRGLRRLWGLLAVELLERVGHLA